MKGATTHIADAAAAFVYSPFSLYSKSTYLSADLPEPTLSPVSALILHHSVSPMLSVLYVIDQSRGRASKGARSTMSAENQKQIPNSTPSLSLDNGTAVMGDASDHAHVVSPYLGLSPVVSILLAMLSLSLLVSGHITTY